MTDLKPEIWYEMQKTLFVENTAVFLASTDGASVLSDNGRKYHKPILSKALTGTYTPYSDIAFSQHSASKQTLEVDTFEYGASEIDWTDKKQASKYDPVGFAGQSIQKSLNTRIEQKFLSLITGARHTVDGQTLGGAAGSYVDFKDAAVFDAFEAATSKLDAIDAPIEDRVAVLGTHSVSAIRKLKSQRETPLGDKVLENGVIGMWNGWLIVQNNNLPYSATLKVATQPTDGDTVTVAGVVFTFKTSLTPTAGEVLIGGSASAARTNLKRAIEGTGTVGTDYVALATEDRFLITQKRYIRATISSNDMLFTGYGDIVVSETLTAAADIWSAQLQDSVFAVRGYTDLVVQIDPNDIRIIEKEKGFADLVKALLGMGAKMFDDGARCSVRTKMDASLWR